MTRYGDARNARITAANGIDYVYRDIGAGDEPVVLCGTFAATSTTGVPASPTRWRLTLAVQRPSQPNARLPGIRNAESFRQRL